VPPDGFALDDVVLDLRVAASRRLVEERGPDGTLVQVETFDGDREFVVTEADGSFAYEHPPAGVALELRIETEFPLLLALEPLAPGEHRWLDVELDCGATVSGRLRDEKGRPVADRELALVPAGAPDAADPNAVACRTDDQGLFQFPPVASGLWRPRQKFEELPDAPLIDTTGGPCSGLELVLPRGGLVQGMVSWRDGAPAESFTVALDGMPFDGRRGRFDLEGLRKGAFSLEVRARRNDALGVAAAERVVTDGEPLELVLTEVPVHPVRVSVVDECGRTPGECEVLAALDDTWGGSIASADVAEGAFELLLPEGRSLVQASTADGRSCARWIQVVPGRNPEVRLELTPVVRKGIGEVSGLVVAPSGEPVAKATVRCGDVEASCDSEGRFSLLRGADWPISARAPDYAESEEVWLEQTPGTALAGIVLRLQEAGRLTGRLLDEGGMDLSEARIDVHWGEHVSCVGVAPDGRFTIEDIGLGPAEVVARDRNGRRAPARVVVTRAPHEPELVLRFPRLDPVRLTVRLTRGGTPVGGGFALRNEVFAVLVPSSVFEVEVPLPGRCTLWAWDWSDSSSEEESLRRTEIVIPDRPTHVLELDLDALPREPFPDRVWELDW